MTVKFGNKFLSGPDTFDELTPDQFLYFTKLYADGLDKSEILKRISYRFTRDTDKVYLKIPLVVRLQIESCYNWLFSEFASTKNIIPEFKHKNITYYGYADKLENVLVQEWEVADPSVREYQRTKDEKYLHRFISALYRPLRSDGKQYGDLREPFDEYACQARENTIASFPAKYKIAILLNYSGLRHNLAKECPEIFKGGSSGRDFGIPGMIHDMAGPELGTVQEIEKNWTIRNLLFIAEKNEIRRIEKKANNAA